MRKEVTDLVPVPPSPPICPKLHHGDDSDSLTTSIKRKIQVLLLFRLALAIFFLVVTIVFQSRHDDDLLSAHLQPLYFFSAALLLFTIVAAFSLRFVHNLRRFGYLQLFFDVEAVTVLIFLSGGIDSLFSFLYMPVIISAALLLHRRGSVFIASLCSLSYGLLLDLQYFDWIKPLQMVAEPVTLRSSSTYFHSILIHIAGFYLVAYLGGYFAEELQKSSRQIRKHEKEFQQLEVLHQNIVQSMNSGLMTISLSGYVLFCNRAAERILRLSSDQVVGRLCPAIFPSLDPTQWPVESTDEDSPAHRDALSQSEIRYEGPGGEKLYLGYTVSVLHSKNGEASGWTFLFQDLTRLKAMEEHVRRMERLALAGRIASEIAHEIKNPLAAMSGAVQMLQTELRQDPIQSRLMDIVDREIVRINDLVTDFLWLARGSVKPERVEPFSICAVVQEVLALLKAKNTISPRHTIRTELRSSPSLLMDPQHFRQILWNLLINGLEAMPEGGELRITVDSCNESQSGPKEARIDIRDAGIGISPELRDRIFEPFFTTKKTGTGLGLSIVYQLAENAGGRLQVTHHDGSGTTFSLLFPISSSFPLAN